MNIVFLDVATPRPYSMITECPGGTEMNVVRVATGLAKRGHTVTVAQRGRTTPVIAYTEIDGPSVHYVPVLPEWVPAEADALVVLRLPAALEHAAQLCSAKKTFLWCHDFNQDQVALHHDEIKKLDVSIVALSRNHAQAVLDAGSTHFDGVNIHVIYPPIDDDLHRDETPVDPHRLFFACSPHKGLERALEAFRAIRAADDRFTLRIANPGYYATVAVNEPGVTVLGTLTNAETIREMRSALCLLHPNDVYAETFGIVHSEANAVGTPALAIALGATPEVLAANGVQLIKEFDLEKIVTRVLAWANSGRPTVFPRHDFRLSRILDRWEELLA